MLSFEGGDFDSDLLESFFGGDWCYFEGSGEKLILDRLPGELGALSELFRLKSLSLFGVALPGPMNAFTLLSTTGLRLVLLTIAGIFPVSFYLTSDYAFSVFVNSSWSYSS